MSHVLGATIWMGTQSRAWAVSPTSLAFERSTAPVALDNRGTRGTKRARVVPTIDRELLRQPRKAQRIAKMLVVLRLLERGHQSRSPGNRITGLDAQDLGRFGPCLLELAQSRVGRSQHNMAGPEVRRSGDTLAQQRQRLRVLFQHVMGKSQEKGGHGRVERIKPRASLEDVDRAPRISRIQQGGAEAPVHEVWIERNRSFKLGYRRLVLALPREDNSEGDMSQG